jgi:parallel beta-helix repeat protein
MYLYSNCSNNILEKNECVENTATHQYNLIGVAIAHATYCASGIYMYQVDSNILNENVCMNNSGDDIYSGVGIYVLTTTLSMLSGNSCSYNSKAGIKLEASSGNNAITANECYNNTFGIWIISSDCLNNVLLDNNILRNTTGISDAGTKTVTFNNSIVDSGALIVTFP